MGSLLRQEGIENLDRIGIDCNYSIIPSLRQGLAQTLSGHKLLPLNYDLISDPECL